MTEDLTAELVTDRPRTPQQWEDLFAGTWPPYIDADPIAAAALPDVHATFPDLQVALTRPAGYDHDEQLAGAAWGVPIVWDGDTERLPAGYSDALVRSLDDRTRGAVADTLVICAAQVHPSCALAGTAAHLLAHLIQTAAEQGLRRVVAPLRLTGKHRYPLIPIEVYARWRRPDGDAFGPWLRAHERMGAKKLSTTAASQCFLGSVEQWQTWSGLDLLASGDYVVAGALSTLRIEVDEDAGRLDEPGVWVRHR
ncbi:hypothetical protein ACUN7V_17095 [Quadrisphaera oryzae]|uniref:hypothetical protein n=1 Tax=Quadrisphaera TaxID=317661 RepID=UPI001645C46B|nr:hypothetical protein [Quadrisphaera sp. RL12-1S]MBC3761828.1 hypothetical protein [Quadrisphaera sp. RL12-1S]